MADLFLSVLAILSIYSIILVIWSSVNDIGKNSKKYSFIIGKSYFRRHEIYKLFTSLQNAGRFMDFDRLDLAQIEGCIDCIENCLRFQLMLPYLFTLFPNKEQKNAQY